MEYIIYGILVALSLLLLLVAYIFKQRNRQLILAQHQKSELAQSQVKEYQHRILKLEEHIASQKNQIHIQQQELSVFKKRTETFNEEAELLSKSLIKAKEMYEELLHQNNEAKIRLKHAMNEISHLKKTQNLS